MRQARVEASAVLCTSLVDRQREVVSAGGAEVGELVDSIEFIIVDDRWCFCVLSQDIRLVQSDGQSEVLHACEKQSISKQHVPDEHIAGEVEEPAI